MLKAIVVSALFLSVPFFAHAETVQKQLCAEGTRRSVKPPAFEGGKTQDLFKSSINNTNFCTDVRVTLGPLGQVIEDTTCICRTQEELESVGCGPNQEQPKITISIPKKISGCVTDNVIISKCARDPKAAYEAQCKSGAAIPGDTDETDSVTIERTPWDISDLPTFSVPSESDAVVKALTHAGVPPAEAQRLSTDQRQNAEEYIRALAEGNTETIKESARKLEINPNLSSNVRSLTADSPPGPTDSPGRTTEGEKLPSAAGFQPPLTDQEKWTGDFPTQCGIQGVAGLMMRPESGCGKALRNPRADVRGPLQFLCGTWNTYAANTGNSQYSCNCSGGYYAGECSYVDDPLISAQVTNAQYDRYRAQYGEWCSGINQRWETCAYAIHFAGEGGFRNLVSAYRSNPNAPLDPAAVSSIFMSSGAYSANREIFAQAGTVGGLFNLLETKLRGGSVTSTYYTQGGVTTNTGYSLNPNFGGMSANVFGGSGVPLPSQTPVLMSPFANASLFARAPAAPQATPIQQGVPSSLQQPVQQPISYPPAQVSLIADPLIGKAGDEFTFTWKSSGVSTQAGCTLALAGSSTLPVARAGTQKVRIRTPQIYALVFSCRGLDGNPAVARTSVFVQ